MNGSSHAGRIKSCKRPTRQEEPTKPASWPNESLTWHGPWLTNTERTQLLFSCSALSVPLSATTCEHAPTNMWPGNRGEFTTLCSRAWPQLHDATSDPSNRVRWRSQLTWEDVRSGAPIAKGQESRHVGQPRLTRHREPSEFSRHWVALAAGNRRGMSLMMSLVSCAILVLLSVMERPQLTHACTMSSLHGPPAQLAHQHATLTLCPMNHNPVCRVQAPLKKKNTLCVRLPATAS